MQKWEYKMITVAYVSEPTGLGIIKYVDGQEIANWKDRRWSIIQALNELGQEAWELVQVIWRGWAAGEVPIYILKRPSL